MGKFSNWLRENNEIEMLIEGAGNLKGLPKKIIKYIVSGTNGGYGGENSEFKLFKSNAKQSDLTAAIKLVGGFVKPSDRGTYRYSKAELEAQANNKAHAGVVVKINGEWAFYAALTYNNKFNLISNSGYVYKETYYTSKGRRHPAETDELTASDLSNYINFKEDDVDIYLVTADAERELKRQERREVKDSINTALKITPERKKALIKFLNTKSNGIIEELIQDINKSTDKINMVIQSSINQAINGVERDNSLKFNEITEELRKKLEKINSLGYQITTIVNQGVIKDKSFKTDTYSYKRFKELINDIEKENI